MVNFNKTKFLIGFLVLVFLIPIKISAATYSATRVGQSHAGIIKLKAGETETFWVKFKNTGTTSWRGKGQKKVVLRTKSGGASKLAHSTWYASYIPNRVNPAATITPNKEALFRFTIQGPKTQGLHWGKFNLFSNGDKIPGGEIEIAVEVTSEPKQEDTSQPREPETDTEVEPAPEPEPEIDTSTKWWQNIDESIDIEKDFMWENKKNGPQIRVGLLYIEPEEKKDYLPLVIKPKDNQSYDIYDGNNKLLVRNTSGEKIQIDYDYDINRYFLNNSEGDRILMTDSHLTIKDKDNKSQIFEISSWKNGPFWGQDVNHNQFENTIEVHYNPNTDRLWLINELALEKYLKGLAEVSDRSPEQFLKAQSIAARTYAMFRYLNHKYTNTPDGKPFFTLRGTQADQVYRGYKRAQNHPSLSQAVKETKGIIATYNNDPILAYYFAQTDGQTYNSEDKNMTREPVPYLKAKNDPPGEGKELRGHGVGLPQIGGIVAANEGANFSQILKYYYTGIDLTKIY